MEEPTDTADCEEASLHGHKKTAPSIVVPYIASLPRYRTIT